MAVPDLDVDPSAARSRPPSSRVPYPLRRSRRKRIGIVLVLAAAAVGAGVTAWALSTSSQASTTPAMTANPRAVDVSVPQDATALSTGAYAPPNWSPVAWISRSGAACYGAADLTVHDRPDKVSCGLARADWDKPGADVLWSKPHFVPQLQRVGMPGILALGFVQGTARDIDVTMTSGQTVSAQVVPLSAPNPGRVGVYEVWLPDTGGRISWTDISRITAKDADGKTVAQLP